MARECITKRALASGSFCLDPSSKLFYRQQHFQTHLSEEENFMNKTDLVGAVAQATDTSKADAANAVDAVL
jgi:hypothetical protein